MRVAANQLLAELNIVGNAALDSDPPDDYTKFDPDKCGPAWGCR